jgi:hypothetical protein
MLLSVVLAPSQMLRPLLPVMVVGNGFTVNSAVAIQPVPNE